MYWKVEELGGLTSETLGRAEGVVGFSPFTPPNFSQGRESSVELLEVCPVLENTEAGVWVTPRNI